MDSNSQTPHVNAHEVRLVCVEGACDPRAVYDYLAGRRQRPTTVVRVERGLIAAGRSDVLRRQERVSP